MQWWVSWLFLLLLASNSDAELYLLKHGGNLYCASDDDDTPALSWNHNLNRENEPLDSVYWSKSSQYSVINCKPEFGNEKCGDWNIRGWKIVNSYEKDLPPVLDFRWNELQRFVTTSREINDNMIFQPYATQLYFPVSILVRDNAVIVLRNVYHAAWRIVIDDWIESVPRMRLEWSWYQNKPITQTCQNCKGLVLHKGTRWTTFTLKYEASVQGDTLSLMNHENGGENTWAMYQSLTAVEELYFYTYSSGLVGHWRIHSYNILEPETYPDTYLVSMKIKFRATEDNRLCISITYIAPHTFNQDNVAYVHLSSQIGTDQWKLFSTSNEWKTVKHVFIVTEGWEYELSIRPPPRNQQGFAIGEIRACSEREFRVSKIPSSAASMCTELKKNKSVTMKAETDIGNGKHAFMTLNHNTLCVGIIPNVEDCIGVTLCDSSVCSCAPGFEGHDCQLVCPYKYYGTACLQECNVNCGGDGSCHHVTGHCNHGCVENWTGDECEQCVDGRYGDRCQFVCNENCIGKTCNHMTGKCTQGCQNGLSGDNCEINEESFTIQSSSEKTSGNSNENGAGNSNGNGAGNSNGNGAENSNGNGAGNSNGNGAGNNNGNGAGNSNGNGAGNSNGNGAENSNGNGAGNSNGNVAGNSNGNGAGNSNGNGAGNSNGNGTGNNNEKGAGYNNANDSENMKVNRKGPDYMGWLLLIPITFTTCVLMYWRRKAIRKLAREFMVYVMPSQGISTTDAPPLTMLSLMRLRAPTSTPPVIPSADQLNVPSSAQLEIPPPVQPRLDVPPPIRPRPSALLFTPEKPSLIVPLFDLAQYIENAVTSGQLDAQHATFPRGLTAPTVEAERKEHAGKNRWRNVLPYDFSRVVLDPLPRKPHSHYINASYIDGYMKEKAFIATQGPRAETVDDFWRLVWQKNISCIIMLCNLTEGQTMKCEQYWPAVGSNAHHKDELQVRTDSEDAFLDHVVRIFSVSRGKNGASRAITQLHYTAWPDHGVPRYAHSLASVLRQVPLQGDAPILVHCSAGVGRTGTVILALAGYVMGQAEGVVDMLALLAKMRSQRPNMVDNATQYEIAHRVLLEMNTLPGSEMPVKNFHAAYRSLQGLGVLQTQFWDLSEACRRDVSDSFDLGWPKDKNRFADIVPGTEGRVILECSGCSYINAVYVDGLRSRDRYIVTQLPLPNTLADFWLMVWQREAKMVVVLNKPEPNFYLNHVTLWSEGRELQLAESLKVRHVGTAENAIFDLHRMVLKYQFPNRSEESREVSVLSVNQWRVGELTPHHTDTLVRLWSEMEKVSGSVVLACHDGATASGLTVSAALMLEHLHATSFVDVASAVRRARRTRPKFITSLTQYEFLYTVALAEVESMDVYVNL